MNEVVCWLLISLFGLTQFAQSSWQHTSIVPNQLQSGKAPKRAIWIAPQYSKLLRFNVYSFSVAAPDSGRVREVVIKVYRGELLLTNFRVRVDGAVIGAEVTDLDNNRFPELYLYSVSDGSGSFGRVYGWQFLPDRKADITISHWQLPAAEGYMGHDSLWVDKMILCRKYPVYQSGDANAQPSGGYRMKRYHLQPTGNTYVLVAE